MLSWKITAIFGVIMLLMAGAGAWYFHYSQGVIADLNNRMGSYETAIKTQAGTITELQTSIAKTSEAQSALSQNFSDIENKTSALQKELARHNLLLLAANKPGLVQTDINNGTKKVLTDFSNITDPSVFSKPLTAPLPVVAAPTGDKK